MGRTSPTSSRAARSHPPKRSASRPRCAVSSIPRTASRRSIDGREFWSLVHGDLKPRNVRLAENGDIKVLDFGIAKALSLSRKVTRNDFGSMPYLSPERLESTEVDAHADLWALGVILYELLSGTPPFQAVDTRRLEQQIRAGYPRRPLPASCPAALQAIVVAAARAGSPGSIRDGRRGPLGSSARSSRERRPSRRSTAFPRVWTKRPRGARRARARTIRIARGEPSTRAPRRGRRRRRPSRCRCRLRRRRRLCLGSRRRQRRRGRADGARSGRHSC